MVGRAGQKMDGDEMNQRKRAIRAAPRSRGAGETDVGPARWASPGDGAMATSASREAVPPARDRENPARELGLLSEIERDPDATQAGLAVKLGVAVGTVNWHLKRMIAKGYVKVKRAERRKLRYIITPDGIALRARLTVAYVENSMALYRQVRKQARQALGLARRKGYVGVQIDGDGDIADVCRLTCLEMGMTVLSGDQTGRAAVLHVDGRRVRLVEPEGQGTGDRGQGTGDSE